jgi:antitoxin CcdA
MRMNIRTPNRPKKKPVNLSIDETLLNEAKAQGLNLSAVLERALAGERAARWLRDNREAIEAYNRDVEERGVWSDGWRRW